MASGSSDVKQPGRMFCWLSGWTEGYRPNGWSGKWELQIAHVASGSGGALRTDDRRAVILLSPLAHMCHVSSVEREPTKTINGIIYPTIDASHTLWLKKFWDKSYWDEEYIYSIWNSNPPEPQRPPERWCQEIRKNLGIAF